MKELLENQEMQTAEELRSQLKGIIPRRLSEEEFRELVEWIKEYQKTIPPFLIEEHKKHVEEISKPSDGIRRN